MVDDPDCVCDLVLMNPPWGQQRKSADRPFLQAKQGTCRCKRAALRMCHQAGKRGKESERLCEGLHCIGEDFGAHDAQLAPRSLSRDGRDSEVFRI